MNNYIFKGSIYPERVGFTLSKTSARYSQMRLSSTDWGIEGMFDMEIKDCKATIVFQSSIIFNITSEPNIETLKNLIEYQSRLFIDTFCFVHSYNYDLIIDSVECAETNLDYTFSVKGEIGFIGKDENFIKYLDTILTKQPNAFADAFADYRRAIKYPHMTAAHCLRAMESIRRIHFDDVSILDDNKRDKDGWRKMSKEIGIMPGKDYKLTQKFATPNRHGTYPIITWEQRKEIMEFTRKVIEKSLDWLSKHS